MSPENSTNVRSKTQAPTLWLRTAVLVGRVLGALSPALAGRWAAWLFFHTTRRPPTDAERAVLATARRSTLSFEGGRLAVWQWGRGPTVLLAHGWNGRGSQLHAIVAPLVAAGHRVVTWDGPGHGASTGASSSLTALGRALAAVARRFGPVRAVVAHSLGGPAAMLAVADGLRVDRVVLVAPPADASSWLARVEDALGLSSEARAHTERFAAARAGRSLETLTAAEILPGLPPMPLLVVHDRDDREVAWSDGATIASLAGGALLPTRGLGHQRILQAPEVVDAIRQFVGKPERRETALEEELRDRRVRWAQVAALG